MAKQFKTAPKRREVIEFELDDDKFHFTPQKVASVMLPVLDHDDDPDDEDDDDDGGKQLTMTQRTWDWLKAGLATFVGEDGEEHSEYEVIRERLADPADDLDVGDVADVVKWLMSKVAGRPTGSRRG